MPASSPGCRSMHVALEAAPLGPAQVHAQQHLRPVLRLGAAGARMDRDDRVLAIVLAAEHLLGLAGVDLTAELVERAREFVDHRLPGFDPLDQDGEVVEPALAASRPARDPLPVGGGAAAASARPPDPSRSPVRRRVASIVASSSAGRAASKIAPQVGGAARQVLMSAKLFVEVNRHGNSIILAGRRWSSLQRARRAARNAATVSASDSQAIASPIRL